MSANNVTEKILRKNQYELSIAEDEQRLSVLTLRSVHYALQELWQPDIVTLVMNFLFEVIVQAEQSIVDLRSARKSVYPAVDQRFAVAFYR